MELFKSEVFEEGKERGRHLGRARRFPPVERFAELPSFGLLGALPAFGLLTALGLTVLVKVLLPASGPPMSKGFDVELASISCEFAGHDRLIVLHVTDSGKLFLAQSHNLEQEDWNNLANRLSQIYSMREDRTLYLLADSDVPFQTVARVLDAARESDVKVRLLTPKALACGTGK